MILLSGLSLTLLLFSFFIDVHGQTCHDMNQYDSCSSNRRCSCLHLSFSDNVGICALLAVNCSRLSFCQSPYDTCSSPDHICVRHPQCDSRPLCYPLSMIDSRLCPPLPPTTTSTISPQTTMTETTMTYFETTATMTGVPEHYVNSYYSNILTADNQQYPQTNKYYQAIQIRVFTSGDHIFISSSTIDTVGHLYHGMFDPSSPNINILTSNDDGAGNNQFKIIAYLLTGISYTLVLTTYQENMTGPYSITATGPSSVQFTSLNNNESTWMPTMTTMSMLLSNSSIYSSALTQNSSIFSPTDNSTQQKYYEALRLSVNTTNFYTLSSESNIDTYGMIYDGDFILTQPLLNLLQENDDGAGDGQFQLTFLFQADREYTLVVTTFNELTTGSYSIVTSDPDNLYLIPID